MIIARVVGIVSALWGVLAIIAIVNKLGFTMALVTDMRALVALFCVTFGALLVMGAGK